MRLKHRIGWTWEGFHARCERFLRGFAWEDVSNMDDWFIDTVEPMLRRLADRKRMISHPDDMTPEEWKEKLLKMADLLHFMSEDNIIEEKLGGYEKHTLYKDVRKLMEENHDAFFKLFSEHFYNLWD